MDPFAKYGNHWKSSTLALCKTGSPPMEVIIFPSKLPQNDGPVHREWVPGIGTRKASAGHIPCRGNVNQLLRIWLESDYENLNMTCQTSVKIKTVIRITGKNPLLATWYNGIAGIVLTCYSVKGMLDLAFWGIWSTKRFCGKKICCHFSTLSTGKKKVIFRDPLSNPHTFVQNP